MCPECGHGSPDPRDERAHIDAHRQLQAFFREWDAGTEPVPGGIGRNARLRVLLVGAVAVLVLLMSVAVFSRINATPAGFQAVAPAQVLPTPQPPPAQPASSTVSTPKTPTATPTATPDPVAVRTDRVVAATPSAVVAAPPSSPVTASGPVAAPSASGAAPEPVAAVAPPEPVHLISACILGICLTVL